MKTTAKKYRLWLAAAVAVSAILSAQGGDSAPFLLDTADGTRIATEGEAIPVAYSPRWGNAASCTVTTAGAPSLRTDEGEIIWTPQGIGGHTLTHTAGDLVYTAQFAVLGDDVAVHGTSGTIGTSETWGADKTHLVTAPLTIPSGVSLTIEADAVVKFMPGTSLTVASGGSCTARGVIFTHVNDDTIGGDTLYDGEGAVATQGDYAITGNITDDDSTEYRYMPPQTLQSNVSSDTRLRGYRTYIVSNSVTVASGATLTLQPGTILKFNTGCSLTVNGTLDAQGTRAAPIVFTSLKDDAHGGDANGDGDKTYAQAGDWHQITGNGTVKLNYCEVLWCSAQNNQGALYPNGGTWQFDNSIVAHCEYDCMRSYGGTFSANNSVFMDASMGAAPSSGTARFNNCVFNYLTTAVRWGNGTFYNCVFSDISQDIIDTKFYSSTLACGFYNCCFWNPNSTGDHASAKVGQNGCFYADPLFVDAAHGDFRIAANSPCVDAGDGLVAPETDWWGRPRMDVQKVKNTGKPDADGVCPDIGIYEVDGHAAVPPADFAVIGRVVLNAPDGVSPGDTITLAYTITNLGASVSGTWRDTIAFSNEVGTVVQGAILETSASMPSNGPSIVIERSVIIPVIPEGEWYVRVNANSYRDVFEQSGDDNNASVSDSRVIVAMPTASLTDKASGTVTKDAPLVRKFTAPERKFYALRVAAPADATVAYGIGALPSGGAQFIATPGTDGYAYVSIPAGATVYVEVASERQGEVTITPFEAGLSVSSVSPAVLPQSGEVTLMVAGLHFDVDAEVLLSDGTTSVAAESVAVSSTESLTAKFDCAKLAAGTAYDLVVTAGGAPSPATASLPNAVTVSGVKGEAELYAKLDMPSSLRQGRSFVFYIDYANEGNIDMPAPIFTVKSDEMIFTTDYGTYTNSVKVIGLGAEGSAGVLKPGESFRMPVKAQVKANTSSRTSVSYSLSSAWLDGSGAEKKLPLSSFFSEDYVYWHGEKEQEEYDAIAAKMGVTWGDFYRNLSGYLTYLDGYGLAATDYEAMAQDFAWYCVNEANEEKSADHVEENSLAGARAFSSNMGLLSLGAASLDGREEILKSDGELASLENPNSRLWRIPGDAKQLRERTAEHYAILKTDNSEPGDVWVWSGSAWYRLYQPTNGYVSSFFNPSRPSVLICHGNLHSVHTDWVKRMAKAWYQAESGNVNVLAVDWGDDSTELTSWTVLLSKASWGTLAGTLVNTLLNLFTPEQAGWPEKAFGTALDIPNVADAAFTQLQAAGVPSGSLTVVGHSHGGHVGGNICSRYGKGKVKRLVLLEVSSLISHWLLPSSQHYPDSWNESSAQTTEFYKTSYWMSLGSFGGFFSNGSDEIPGMYNFMVIPEKCSRYSNAPSYFEHEWALQLGGHNPNADKGWFGFYFMNGYFKNSDSDNAEGRMEAWRHDNVEEWFIETISKGNSGKWKNLGYHWNADESPSYFGMPSNLAVKYSKQYHGVISRRLGHEGLELRKPAGWVGEWRYEKQILENKFDINFTRPMLDCLQDNVAQAIEYRIGNPNVPDAIDEKNHKVSFTITNAADNLSINYRDINKFWMQSENEAHAPWQKDVGVGVWLCRNAKNKTVPAESSTIDELRNNSDLAFLRVKNWKIESLERFTQPTQKSVRQFSLNIPPKFGKDRIDAKNGEDFLLVIGVGVSSKGGDVSTPQDYFGDLCHTNNWYVKKVKVKPTNTAVIVINGNEYEDGDTANILIGEEQTSVSLSISAQSLADGVYDHKWDSQEGRFASKTSQSTTWTLTLSADSDSMETDLSLKRSITSKEPNETITFGPDVVRVRLVRKHEGPGDQNGGGSSSVPQSCDPNEMNGPEGVGEKRYVQPGDWMTYTVFFENKVDAKAAAQFVAVENPLNEWLDWSTFEMGDVGFGTQVDTGLTGLKNGTSEATMEGTNLVVRTEVSLDEESGVASWFLRIVSPYGDSDGWPYADDPTGFLPPNDATHRGEGHITYRIKVRDDAPANVVITNSASIVFDYNDPIETDPAWWNTVGSPGAAFSENEIAVDEGGTATVKVMGGSADAASSVKVYLTYNTAAAADVDLKAAAWGHAALPSDDTVGRDDLIAPQQTNLKFPLTLNWEKGEIGEKVITIPIKADKTVEDDEFFTLQLAEADGMELGDVRVCTVTIRDLNDKTLKAAVTAYKPKKDETVATNSVTVTGMDGGFFAGTGAYTSGSKLTLTAEARPGWAFVGWRRAGDSAPYQDILSTKAKWQVVVTNDEEYVAVFEKIPYVRGLADPADGGKVAGSGYCAAGKKATLKATANKNYTFVGWLAIDSIREPSTAVEYVATTPTLVIDRTAKPAANSKTSTTVTEIDGDMTYFAVFKSDPKVTVAVEDTDGKGAVSTGKGAGKYVAGTITGAGKYAPGKKVTLKAAANKGYVFAGWDSQSIAIDSNRQQSSITFAMPSNNVECVAKFVTAEEDKESIALAVDGVEMRRVEDNAPHQTNIWAGVYLEWPVAAGALSEPKVKVSGLPAGLKFTDKPVTTKIGIGKTAVTVTNVPANTIYGAPAAASKTGRDGAVAPYPVKVTVTTAGKSAQTYKIDMFVDALPSWAVGTFDGWVLRDDGGDGRDEARPSQDEGDSIKGIVALTVAANGKISGKLVDADGTWTLSAASFDRAGSPASEGGSPVFAATATGKNGKMAFTNDVEVSAEAFGESMRGVASGGGFAAWLNLWKTEPWKTGAKAFAKAKPLEFAVDGGTVTLKFAATGAATAAGRFATGTDARGREMFYQASCTAALVPDAESDGAYRLFLYFPPKAGKFEGFAAEIRLVWDGAAFSLAE